MKQRTTGFTLIEMIMVIVLTSIIAVMISSILNRPLLAYIDTQRRTELVNTAQVALTRMASELEHALPNSIRIDATGQILEFMPFHAVGRYRTGNAGEPNGLTTSIPDREFNNLGDIDDGITGRVVIYNTSPGILYADATGITPANTGVITEVDNLVTINNCYIDTTTDTNCADAAPVGSYLEQVDRLTLTRNHRFDPNGSGSPASIFYLVNDAVTYFCDPSTSTITRLQGYNITVNQTTNLATLASSAIKNSLLANSISSCQFVFDPGNGSYRASLISLSLSLEKKGETVNLLKEVHLWNAP